LPPFRSESHPLDNVLRVRRSLTGTWKSIRANLLLNPSAWMELEKERAGHEVAGHQRHLDHAIGWLVRAQDIGEDRGFSRGFGVAFSPYWGSAGWQPSYPETTGYIIPTLLEAGAHLGLPELRERAIAGAQWESEIQLESGAVQGGVVGQGRSPAVFNTGQVLLGWLAAYQETGREEFATSARRAGQYLVSVQEKDGHWRKGNSQFANSETTLYNARVAWALAEAGERLKDEEMKLAAARNLAAVLNHQHANGWFPNCCLTDPSRPLLHTLAYTTRGLLEGGRVLADERLLNSAIRIARALARSVREDGWMPGRFDRDWNGTVAWSCLTGEAQMANNWMRLFAITGDSVWLEPVPRVLAFLKKTQNTTSDIDGLRGGIKGSFPMSGDYGRFEVLNWATKYFADALMRHQQILDGSWERRDRSFSLA
jgi:hypothetical protein